jgi:hypothetical protein
VTQTTHGETAGEVKCGRPASLTLPQPPSLVAAHTSTPSARPLHTPHLFIPSHVLLGRRRRQERASPVRAGPSHAAVPPALPCCRSAGLRRPSCLLLSSDTSSPPPSIPPAPAGPEPPRGTLRRRGAHGRSARRRRRRRPARLQGGETAEEGEARRVDPARFADDLFLAALLPQNPIVSFLLPCIPDTRDRACGEDRRRGPGAEEGKGGSRLPLPSLSLGGA